MSQARSHTHESNAPQALRTGQATTVIPWRVGSTLREARTQKGWSLERLAAATKELDPEGQGVQKAQIDRIERGVVSPDFREVVLLCKALQKGIDKLLEAEPKTHPWFKVRWANAEKMLTEVINGTRTMSRVRGQHRYMISRGIYRYVPLASNDDYTEPEERDGTMLPQMRKYLFSVAYATDQQMMAGLYDHGGEEIVFVIEGELELWLQRPDADEIRKLTLEPRDCVQYRSEILHSYRARNKNGRTLALFIYCQHREGSDVLTPEIINLRIDRLQGEA